jgi:hypothetical protein
MFVDDEEVVLDVAEVIQMTKIGMEHVEKVSRGRRNREK